MRKFITLAFAALALSLAAPVASASAMPAADVLAKADVTPAKINPDTKSAANEFGNCYCRRTYYRVRYYRVRYVPVRYTYRYHVRYYVYRF